MYEDLPRLVKKLREMKYKSILVISNGTVGEEKYEQVIPYVDAIQISVDGSVREVHDLSRGEGSYDKMLSNLERLKKLGLSRLVISFTPTSKNIEDLPNIPKFAYDHNVDAIHITRLMPVGRGQKLDDNLTADSVEYTTNFKKFVDNFNNIEKLISIDSELNGAGRSLISLTFAGDQSYKVAYRQKSGRRDCDSKYLFGTCRAGKQNETIYYLI